MKYLCQDFFMIRIPSLPIEVFKQLNSIDEFSYELFWENEKIKEFIEESTLVASKDLYYCLEHLPVKGKKLRNFNTSILKYLIRASIRPTPYGLYAGVGLGRFSDFNDIIIEQDNYHKDIKLDSQWTAFLIHQVEKNSEILRQLNIKFNPICYNSGNHVYNPYYTNHGENDSEDENLTEKSDIRFTKLIQLIQKCATDFIPYNSLKQLIIAEYAGVPEEEVDNVLSELIDNEYLYTNLRLPAFCPDSLAYMINILKNVPQAHLLVDSLNEIQAQLMNYKKAAVKAPYLRTIYDNLSSLYKTKNYCVVNKALKFKANYIDVSLKKRLEHFAETLSIISIEPRILSRIEKFKKAFIEKYGYGIEVGILDIINPDGFDGLSYLDEISKFQSEREKKIKKVIDDRILLSFINHESEVNLRRDDFVELDKLGTDCLPLSFDINLYISAKQNISGESFVLSIAPNVGAIKAGGMFQRFADSYDKKDLEEYNSIYLKEKASAAEKGYILVEVREAPRKGRHTNLLNQYKNYDYFIPIGCDGMKVQGELSLNKLFVGLSQNGELYIYSSELDKKCKIVTDNMLNINMNSSLLRLLKYISDDYESQTIGRIFHLTQNRYSFTPRILLDDVIISPKKWNLDISNISSADKFEKDFTELAHKYQIDKYVLVYHNDNRLLLNCEKKWSIQLLYTIAKHKKALLLSEIPHGIFEKQLVQDEYNNNYFAEYTFSFVKEKNTDEYKTNNSVNERKIMDKPIITLQNKHRILLPGESGWIYLKLYGSLARQNIILTKELPAILKRMELKKFFFLRYSDPKPHLRIRFQFENDENIAFNLKEVIQWIENLKNNAYIYKAVFDTYERENNRYGGEEIIDKVESFFCADSQYAIALLNLFDMKGDDESKVYMTGILSILMQFLGTNEELYDYLDERGIGEGYKDLSRNDSKNYLKITEQILSGKWDEMDKRLISVSSQLDYRIKALIEFKNAMNIAEVENRISNKSENIVQSLVHMFCNRITGNKILERKYNMILRYSMKNIVMFEKHKK